MNYLHGGDIYRNQVDYDFSVNINPLGIPEGSLQGAIKGLQLSGRYPDYEGEELRTALSKKEGVPFKNILLGNGAGELIYTLCFALRPKKAVTVAPAFAEYEQAVLCVDGQMELYNLKEENGFSLQSDILDYITNDTDIFFLCNPNNPTGEVTNRELLEQIAIRCEQTDTYFCVDECFLPFLDEEESFTMKHMLERFLHLIMIRAFTKIYGMPGLRLGYAMSANQALLQKMRRCLQPWNTSIPAQMAGIEALKDDDYLVRTRTFIKEERAFLVEQLQNGLADKVYTPYANYIFFRSEKNLKEKLLQKKILIRSCANYHNLTDEYYRIGIRTKEENLELIRKWREL